MAAKKDETASFVLLFTQKIFQNDKGESEVQWRGNIRHVQGGDEKRFSEFDDVVTFTPSGIWSSVLKMLALLRNVTSSDNSR